MALRNPQPFTLSLGVGGSGSLPPLPTRRWGTAHIKNIGPGEVFFAFNAIPAAAPADGQGTLASGESYNADNLADSTIGFYAVAATRVEVIFYEAAQDLFT
jgi:hypothetical protein